MPSSYNDISGIPCIQNLLSKNEMAINIGVVSVAFSVKRFLFDFKSIESYNISFDMDQYTSDNYCFDRSGGTLRLIHQFKLLNSKSNTCFLIKLVGNQNRRTLISLQMHKVNMKCKVRFIDVNGELVSNIINI